MKNVEWIFFPFLALPPSNVKVSAYQIVSNVILFWRCNQASANVMHKLENQQETLYFYNVDN